MDMRLSISRLAFCWARAAAIFGFLVNSRVGRLLWTGVLINWTSLRMLAMLSESFTFALATSLDGDGVLVVLMPSNMEVRGLEDDSVVSVAFEFEGVSSVA